jgi:hypothetical protein
MDRQPSTYRTDEQLDFLLDQTGDWVVNDADGFVVWPLGSLREAIATAQERMNAGELVRAVSRLSPDRIIVFGDQIERLAILVADRNRAADLENT